MRYCQPAGILLSPVKSVSVLFRRVFGTSVRRRMSGPGPEKVAGKKFVFSSPAPFTLIELLVSKTCQTGVLPLYHLKKQSKKCLIMLATQALHALKVRFIFAAGKCFIRRSRASFDQRSR